MLAVPRGPVRDGNRSSATSNAWKSWNRLRVDSKASSKPSRFKQGRESRVIASAKDTDDAKAAKVCREIARAFEQQLTYPVRSRLRSCVNHASSR